MILMPGKISRRNFLKRAAGAYSLLAFGRIPNAASARRPVNGSASRNPAAKPVPKQIAYSPKDAASQWVEILKVYPDWQRQMNIPRFAGDANAAKALVESVALKTGARSVDVLAVKAKYTISSYAKPGYRLSETELKIFNSLLAEAASNKQVFDYLSMATRAFFTKRRILALAAAK